MFLVALTLGTLWNSWVMTSFPRPEPKHLMSSKIMIGPKAWLSHCALNFSRSHMNFVSNYREAQLIRIKWNQIMADLLFFWWSYLMAYTNKDTWTHMAVLLYHNFGGDLMWISNSWTPSTIGWFLTNYLYRFLLWDIKKNMQGQLSVADASILYCNLACMVGAGTLVSSSSKAWLRLSKTISAIPNPLQIEATWTLMEVV